MTYNPDGENTHERDDLASIADHAYDDFDEAMTETPKRYFGEVTYLAPVRVTVCQGTIDYSAETFRHDPGEKWSRQINDPAAWEIAEKVNKEARSRGDRNSQGIFNVKEVEMNITPLDPSFTIIERRMAINKPGWQQVVRPSLKALEERIAEVKSLALGQFNVLTELLNLFVEYESVIDPGNKPGKTYTVPRFLNVYAVREECQAASDAYFGGGNEPDNAPDEQSAKDATRANLVAFLEAFWAQVGHDPDKLAEALPANDLLKDHFTMESDVVQKLIKETTNNEQD